MQDPEPIFGSSQRGADLVVGAAPLDEIGVGPGIGRQSLQLVADIGGDGDAPQASAALARRAAFCRAAARSPDITSGWWLR
jgi:hypothetical protein